MICVLSGGTGGAKFVDGLRQVMPAEDITLVVNTGDDLLWWGLYVSPDIDSITYVLSGMLSRERGWGVKGDTFLCLQAMGQLGEPTWFHTGDRDLAMHLLRSRLLAEGKTLSDATTVISEKLGVKARILPMSDSRVETRVDTPVGELSFEEYFVQRWYQDPVNSVRFAGASDAEPAPGVIDAISLRRRGSDRAEQSHHQHRPDSRRARHSRSADQRSRKNCRHQPHRGQCSGRGSGGNSDGRARTALLDRRRRPGLRRFSRHPDLRHARRPRRRRHSARTACACSVRKPSCAAAEDKAALAREVLSFVAPVRAQATSRSITALRRAVWTASRDSGSRQEYFFGKTAAGRRSRSTIAHGAGPGHAARRAHHSARLEEPPAGCSRHQRSLRREARREYEFEVIPDPDNPGETGAIEMATRICVERGADSTLVIPADIPLIEAWEFDEILKHAPAEGSVLVPAADGRGTNAAFRRPANLFPLRFGNDSFKPHHAAAQATGKPCVVLNFPESPSTSTIPKTCSN